MIWILIVLLAFVGAALLCAALLTRAAQVPASEVGSMKKTLERRVRERAEFRL